MASAETADESQINSKLSEIFDEGFHLYNSFDSCNDPVNSTEFQVNLSSKLLSTHFVFSNNFTLWFHIEFPKFHKVNIKRCMKIFENSTKLVSLADMFSSNESYDEIPTNNLKYLLLPYFLGNLSLKLCGGDRTEIVEVAKIYYRYYWC